MTSIYRVRGREKGKVGGTGDLAEVKVQFTAPDRGNPSTRVLRKSTPKSLGVSSPSPPVQSVRSSEAAEDKLLPLPRVQDEGRFL